MRMIWAKAAEGHAAFVGEYGNQGEAGLRVALREEAEVTAKWRNLFAIFIGQNL